MLDTVPPQPPTNSSSAPTAPEPESLAHGLRRRFGQIVLVLQGGGALGAYQVGVYQALHEAGIEPDWVIGTSIGAINASLIAGNPLERRLERLDAFWSRVEHGPLHRTLSALPVFGTYAANWLTITQGIEPFFTPNPFAFAGPHVPLGAEQAGYYSTRPLEATLRDLVDQPTLNHGGCRLTVGAANVGTGQMRYFDSRDMRLDLRHVMASGALPPAFPAVRIDGQLYWDGGILSNTPVEAVFDDNPRRNSLVFAIHIWNPEGAEPTSIWEVMGRQKDLQYASRAHTHITRQKQLHRLRHVVAELARRLPEEERQTPEVRELESFGCLTRMHVVRLLAQPVEGQDHTGDVDFSRDGIAARRQAGYENTRKALADAPWERAVDEVEGLVLHENASDPSVGSL
ncbi:patatin-like phospholipase family protein [Methylorubrum populi]|uniref:Patatin n=2 Tax=Methylobacteriaceae TaxID=119045 RepID=A0A160PLJ4_9HYPH|nr:MULTISPECIES: patatin-like phospholipase family protein [Methylobacteriaceae]MBY0256400.1 patatin-like phospholipase family protein [Methylobacterium sp.]MCB4802776.1 patatin-like phospholipase family protein [Methylobacterium brachiatum]MDQ0543410.1 NTE family protein [Methylobacterium brachiatum]BAU94064.1 patatin [Methylorubrum populi]